MSYDPASTPTLMFGIMRREGHDPVYRLVFFDLLTEEEAERAFEDLLKHDVVFSGYTVVDASVPTGLNAATLGQIRSIVDRLNGGEDLSQEDIKAELASVVV